MILILPDVEDKMLRISEVTYGRTYISNVMKILLKFSKHVLADDMGKDVVKLLYYTLDVINQLFLQRSVNITPTHNKTKQLNISAFFLYTICRKCCNTFQANVAAT
jgi:hypothetical protein